MKSPPTVLIPAAGFGRRMGSPEAKELMPLREGQPLIDEPLKMALQRNWQVVLITRKEKKSLVDHVLKYKEMGLSLEVLYVLPTKEWPESLLLSKEKWNLWNLVVLPDTFYAPFHIWDQMFEATNSDIDLVVAQHSVSCSSKWGVLNPDTKGLVIAEKQKGFPKAWGLYMFSEIWGERILKAQLQSQQENKLIELAGCRSFALDLDVFGDFTRGS